MTFERPTWGDSGTGRTDHDPLARRLGKAEADIRRIDRKTTYQRGRKRNASGSLVAARFESNNPVVNHGGASKKFEFTLSDYAVNADGLTFTPDDSGHIIDGWPPGWYDLKAQCKVWYTSPSGGLRPSVLLAGGGSAWDDQWLPIDLPAKASEISPAICFGLAVDLNIDAGDSGFYVELGIYTSSAGDTVNASCILEVTRQVGYPGAVT